MKNMKKVLTLVVALSMLVAILLTGCAPAPAAVESSKPAESSSAPAVSSEAPAASSSAVASSEAPASEAPLAEIYSKLPNTCLSGVQGPNLKDRADVKKAWPKTPKDPKNIVIGWTEITLGNPWFVEMANAAKAKAKEYGFTLNMLVADSNLQKQSEQIDTFITQGVDIIVVDPTDVLGPVNDIKRAVDAGIPVVGMGTVMDDSAPILTTVLLNPFEVGYACGQYIGTKFDATQTLNIGIILGVMGNSTSESRICGGLSGIIEARQKTAGTFKTKQDAMLAGFNLFQQVKTGGKGSDPANKMEVLGFGDGQWNETDSLKVAEDMLTASGDKLNLILCCNDFEGVGAIKAVKAANLQDKVKVAACADGAKTGLDLVKSGEMMCTGTFAGPAFGAGTIEFIKAIFIDGKDPSNLAMGTYSGVDVISPDNMDKYYDPDPKNLFYKFPAIEFPKTIPEIIASFK